MLYVVCFVISIFPAFSRAQVDKWRGNGMIYLICFMVLIDLWLPILIGCLLLWASYNIPRCAFSMIPKWALIIPQDSQLEMYSLLVVKAKFRSLDILLLDWHDVTSFPSIRLKTKQSTKKCLPSSDLWEYSGGRCSALDAVCLTCLQLDWCWECSKSPPKLLRQRRRRRTPPPPPPPTTIIDYNTNYYRQQHRHWRQLQLQRQRQRQRQSQRQRQRQRQHQRQRVCVSCWRAALCW